MDRDRVAASATGRVWAALGLTIVVIASACGAGSPTNAVDGPNPAPGEGLALRIIGTVEGDVLCPGDRRPCLRFTGSVEPGSDGFVWVSGRMADATFRVDDQQPLPGRPNRDYTNRCSGQDITGSQPPEALESLYEDPSAQPAGFVDLWDSDDGVLHLGVSGDTGPAEALLDELGIADQVCVVDGFPYPDATLESVQTAVSAAAADEGYDSYGVSRDSWEGTVTINLPSFDVGFRDRLDEISAANGEVPTIALADVEVINGSLADFEDALADAGVSSDPSQQLRATCGPVTFSSVPPDPGEFPPLDDDAAAALDELVNGPTGVEASGFGQEFAWSIARRTDDRLVLLGQGSGPEGAAYVYARFDGGDPAWRPTGWGGCRVEIEAPGLGPASVATSSDQPPDPASTELALLINEQACASGRAPIDREVVPVVTETDTDITILVLVAPVEGDSECPGNPWHPITVALDAPLGDRQLFDGHHHPPQPIEPVEVADLDD